MKSVVLSGSVAGTKTIAVARYTEQILRDQRPGDQVVLVDLSQHELVFSDGRNYLDYTGDTKTVVTEVMEAELVIIASPIYQASIPGGLKNLLDLLPSDAFRDTVVGMIITAGSLRHYHIPETQFKPVLAYLKAQVLANYVFIEDKDIHRGEVDDDDAVLRIHRFVDDALTTAEVFQEVQRRKDRQYGF